MTHAGGRNWWKGGYPPWAQWGNYSHQRGILNFGLSAYALNPWAGTIKYGVPRTLARIRRNIIYWAVRKLICVTICTLVELVSYVSTDGRWQIEDLRSSINAQCFLLQLLWSAQWRWCTSKTYTRNRSGKRSTLTRSTKFSAPALR